MYSTRRWFRPWFRRPNNLLNCHPALGIVPSPARYLLLIRIAFEGLFGSLIITELDDVTDPILTKITFEAISILYYFEILRIHHESPKLHLLWQALSFFDTKPGFLSSVNRTRETAAARTVVKVSCHFHLTGMGSNQQLKTYQRNRPQLPRQRISSPW